ncbi:MAG TPA: Holliday junction resolvase RuvX [Dehalococcoidia bacterium]|nr:Holliday junction resolvase RuvX [Dehalococcoidia bacterium]
MRTIGLDLGDRRIGVAISDPQGLLAVPLTVVNNEGEDATIANIVKLAEQYEAEWVVIGLPYSLNGSLGQQASKVTTFAKNLSQHTRAKIQLWDERLSTKAADRLMSEAGTKRNKRKQHRDALAAAFILQGFLDSLREGEQCRDT